MPEREIIRSRQNRNVVELCKLTDRKERERSRTFRFDGIKLLQEAIRNRLELQTIFLRESDGERILQELETESAGDGREPLPRILTLSDDLFDRVSEEKSPDGVISIAKYIDKFQKIVTIYNSADFSELSEESIVLLESVRDPSNIGAIIRSAAAIGVDRLILSKDCADIYHPRAVRASMGTLFNQKIDRVEDFTGTIRGLTAAGRRVFAAALLPQAELLGSFPTEKGDCVVIGNEGNGITPQTAEACGRSVLIPMSGRAESFNAAVAASILMWEFRKSAMKEQTQQTSKR